MELDRAWLDHRLQHTDPAEREVLADYVQALLRHAEPGSDTTKLQSKLHTELADFLADQTDAFVRDLLAHLSGANGGGEEAGPQDVPPAAPHALPSTSTGTSTSTKTPPFTSTGTSTGASASGSTATSTSTRPCRDFHQRGYCARGETCKFSHAPPALQDGARRDRGRDRSRSPGREGDVSGKREYRAAPLPGHPESSVPGGLRIGASMPYDPWGERRRYPAQVERRRVEPGAGYGYGPDRRDRPDRPDRPDWVERGETVERERGGLRGGRPGPERFDLSAYDPDASIVVEHLPPHALSDAAIHGAFAPYGPVEAIQLDSATKRALVVFSPPGAGPAQAAHDDPSGFFSSRFVRVFYADGRDRPTDRSRGSTRERGRGRGAPSFRGAGRGQTYPSHGPGQQGVAHVGAGAGKKTQALGAAATATVEAKTAAMRVEALLGEQKRLMASLMASPPPNAEVKTATMVRLRELAQQIPPATEKAKRAQEQATTARAEAVRVQAEEAEPGWTEQGSYASKPSALSERARLDAELDAMAADRG